MFRDRGAAIQGGQAEGTLHTSLGPPVFCIKPFTLEYKMYTVKLLWEAGGSGAQGSVESTVYQFPPSLRGFGFKIKCL